MKRILSLVLPIALALGTVFVSCKKTSESNTSIIGGKIVSITFPQSDTCGTADNPLRIPLDYATTLQTVVVTSPQGYSTPDLVFTNSEPTSSNPDTLQILAHAGGAVKVIGTVQGAMSEITASSPDGSVSTSIFVMADSAVKAPTIMLKAIHLRVMSQAEATARITGANQAVVVPDFTVDNPDTCTTIQIMNPSDNEGVYVEIVYDPVDANDGVVQPGTGSATNPWTYNSSTLTTKIINLNSAIPGALGNQFTSQTVVRLRPLLAGFDTVRVDLNTYYNIPKYQPDGITPNPAYNPKLAAQLAVEVVATGKVIYTVAGMSFTNPVYEIPQNADTTLTIKCNVTTSPAGGPVPALTWTSSTSDVTVTPSPTDNSSCVLHGTLAGGVAMITATDPVSGKSASTIATVSTTPPAPPVVGVPMTGIYLQVYNKTFNAGEYWFDNESNVTAMDLLDNATQYAYVEVMPYPANTTDAIDYSQVTWTVPPAGRSFNAPTGAANTGKPVNLQAARITPVASLPGSGAITVTYKGMTATLRINVLTSVAQAAAPTDFFVRVIPNPAAFYSTVATLPTQGISALPTTWSCDDMNNATTINITKVDGLTNLYDQALYLEIMPNPAWGSYTYPSTSTWTVSPTGIIATNAAAGGAGITTRQVCRIHATGVGTTTLTNTLNGVTKTITVTVQ